jgi:hypothetical protein
MAKKKKSKKQAKADKQQAPAPAFGNISDEQQRQYEREIRLSGDSEYAAKNAHAKQNSLRPNLTTTSTTHATRGFTRTALDDETSTIGGTDCREDGFGCCRP